MTDDDPRDNDARVDDRRDDEGDALLSRLRVIEDQPLETRAEALNQIHDELRAILEAGDVRPSA
jgi:hypothetical protein